MTHVDLDLSFNSGTFIYTYILIVKSHYPLEK